MMLHLKAAKVEVGADVAVEIECTSRALVDTNVLGGKVGRLVGVVGTSMLCVKLQAASSRKPMVEATLEIFMEAMLP